jgi:sortase (surface protein transpeptidase)
VNTRFSKRQLKWFGSAVGLVVVLSLVLIVLVAWLANRGVVKLPLITHQSTKVNLPTSYQGLPARLLIPDIGVDAAIEDMGVAPNGDMAAPVGSIDVGWSRYGPLPGETGSAVMDGHVVGLAGEQGVFFKLRDLQAGAIIQVIDTRGKMVSFTVIRSESFDQLDQPIAVFSSGSGTHLNLITCGGDWDPVTRHYLQRLIVFADQTP